MGLGSALQGLRLCPGIVHRPEPGPAARSPGRRGRPRRGDGFRQETCLVGIVAELLAKGESVEFVDVQQLSVSTKEGLVMINIFAASAELEHQSIRERQLEGIAIAKAAGKCEKAPKL